MLESIQRNVAWRAIPLAGLVAGTVFLVVSVLLMPVFFEVDGTLTLRYFASLALGDAALTNADTSILLVGIVVHYVLSLLFTLVIAIVVHRWGMLVGIIGGAVLGLALYGINLYTMTLLFPWFFAINSVLLIISHVLFGAVAGGVYEFFDDYDQPFFKEQS